MMDHNLKDDRIFLNATQKTVQIRTVSCGSIGATLNWAGRLFHADRLFRAITACHIVE